MYKLNRFSMTYLALRSVVDHYELIYVRNPDDDEAFLDFSEVEDDCAEYAYRNEDKIQWDLIFK